MSTPTSRELALESEVRRLRERIALLERGNLAAAHTDALAGKNRPEAALEALPGGATLVEQKFSTLFRLSPISITVSDLNDGERFLEVNDAFEQFTGHTRESAIGKTYSPDRLWADAQEYAQAVAQFTSSGQLNGFEFRFRHTSGEIRSGQLWARSIDFGGKQCLLAMTIDVTERKRAEAALVESEQRFRSMADSAPVMIWMSGLDKLCTFFNKPWLDFRGRVMEQELGNGWADGVHPEDLDRCLATYTSSFDARRSFRMEYRLRRADGEYRWILDNGTPLYQEGEFAGYIGSCIDVTEQKLVEERLRASEAQLMEAQLLAKVGSWELELEADRVHWSDEMFRIYGLAGDAPLNFPALLSYIHPADREKFLEADQLLLASDAPVELEHRVIRPDGEVRLVHCTGQTIRNYQGKVVRIVGVTQDITDSRRAQEESFERQKLESVGRLAGGIAHDFNNILGGILAQAELGLAEVAARALPQDELENIRAVAIRGTGIGRQLMIYAGQESVISEPVDISSLIEDIHELLKVAVSKHVVLTIELARNMSPVLANPAQLRQVVMNLVANASEAIGEQDGIIVIRTGQTTAGLNSPRGGSGECIVLEISDTGVGISREAQPKIFDPFFTTKSAGHGLGLAVVQRIVQELGGVIQVDTELGRGATFRILLPVIGEMTRPSREATATVDRGQLNCNGIVLMVEDESSIRLAMASMLRLKGLRVVEAADGTEALASIHKHKDDIALVLLDVTLPGAPSREVLTEARRVRQGVKVIMVSAYGQNTVDASFPGMRIDAFLRKPYTLEELMSLMARVLSAEADESRASSSTNQGIVPGSLL